MKKILKKFGKIFITLKFRDYNILKQTALIIDNDCISKEHLNLVIENTRKSFSNTHIVLLTFNRRKKYISDEFRDIEIASPDERFWIKRYQIAIWMLKMRDRNFDFIILTSLDISPIIVAMFFTRAQVWLFNQWNQWWLLRQRTAGDLLKIPAALIWLIFIGTRNTIIFLYLLFSVGFFWLKRFFPFRRT
ncbi:MAG: hypothetical protein FJZ16_05910 [Candidatus Omnitrophica bacterium]|nr:hypothetical protein [Candidatus Omnitrophota bacterium]